MVVGEKMNTLSIVLDEDTLNKVQDYKKRTGIPVSTFIRSLIRKWMEEEAKIK